LLCIKIDSIGKPQLKATLAKDLIFSSKNVSKLSNIPNGGTPPTINSNLSLTTAASSNSHFSCFLA